ncbi:hypothetical protein F4859DRAFT_321993 [Xylaria cf. heliscus]|nr:hypothetical protein F4859DRAFT_321993 [Xylaria cf. heliscus]
MQILLINAVTFLAPSICFPALVSIMQRALGRPYRTNSRKTYPREGCGQPNLVCARCYLAVLPQEAHGLPSAVVFFSEYSCPLKLEISPFLRPSISCYKPRVCLGQTTSHML